jgi:hypothetical protein
VIVKGVNAADVPVEFGLAAHSRHGVIAVISRTAARISGQVRDERGTTIANAPVIVFAADRSRWDDRSIHRQLVHADQNGRYLVSVPPGDYWLVAADAAELNSKVLEQLSNVAVRVTAGVNAEVSQDIRPAPKRD